MIELIHHDNRSLAAGTNTTADLECDQSVWCGLTRFDPQNLLGFVDQLRSSTNVAGGSNAEFNDMFTARFGGEERVKGNYAMDLTHWYIQLFGNISLHRFGYEANSFLKVVENHHQGAILLSELRDGCVDNLFHPGIIEGIQLLGG